MEERRLLSRRSEGTKPIFDRDDIIVNKKRQIREERLVVKSQNNPDEGKKYEKGQSRESYRGRSRSRSGSSSRHEYSKEKRRGPSPSTSKNYREYPKRIPEPRNYPQNTEDSRKNLGRNADKDYKRSKSKSPPFRIYSPTRGYLKHKNERKSPSPGGKKDYRDHPRERRRSRSPRDYREKFYRRRTPPGLYIPKKHNDGYRGPKEPSSPKPRRSRSPVDQNRKSKSPSHTEDRKGNEKVGHSERSRSPRSKEGYRAPPRRSSRSPHRRHSRSPKDGRSVSMKDRSRSPGYRRTSRRSRTPEGYRGHSRRSSRSPGQGNGHRGHSERTRDEGGYRGPPSERTRDEGGYRGPPLERPRDEGGYRGPAAIPPEYHLYGGEEYWVPGLPPGMMPRPRFHPRGIIPPPMVGGMIHRPWRPLPPMMMGPHPPMFRMRPQQPLPNYNNRPIVIHAPPATSASTATTSTSNQTKSSSVVIEEVTSTGKEVAKTDGADKSVQSPKDDVDRQSDSVNDVSKQSD